MMFSLRVHLPIGLTSIFSGFTVLKDGTSMTHRNIKPNRTVGFKTFPVLGISIDKSRST